MRQEPALFPPFQPAPDPRLVSLAQISVPHLESATVTAAPTPQQGSPPTSALYLLTPPIVSAWLITFPKEAHVGQHLLRFVPNNIIAGVVHTSGLHLFNPLLPSELRWFLHIRNELYRRSLLERHHHRCPGHRLCLLWRQVLGRGRRVPRVWWMLQWRNMWPHHKPHH